MTPALRPALAAMLLALAAPVSAASPAASPAPSAANARKAAPAHPDFTGRWRLCVQGSEYAGAIGARPRERRDEIVMRGDTLSEHSFTVREGGDTLQLRYRYATDGREVTNEVAGSDVRSTARWDANALVIESHASMLLLDVSVRERWTLSPDGRTLVMERVSKLPVGSSRQRLVFARE